MAYAGTSGGGHATRNIVIALLLAGIAATLIAVFAFGAFGIRDSYNGGGLEGGGDGGDGGSPLPYGFMDWHHGDDLLTFV